ncbi:MAG: hypothetical protein PHE87_06195 [Victivallaceae bacterium]|nr:hypothetical protein [Victivallaceae bacterium]
MMIYTTSTEDGLIAWFKKLVESGEPLVADLYDVQGLLDIISRLDGELDKIYDALDDDEPLDQDRISELRTQARGW